jgi:hypothetical protein
VSGNRSLGVRLGSSRQSTFCNLYLKQILVGVLFVFRFKVPLLLLRNLVIAILVRLDNTSSFLLSKLCHTSVFLLSYQQHAIAKKKYDSFSRMLILAFCFAARAEEVQSVFSVTKGCRQSFLSDIATFQSAVAPSARVSLHPLNSHFPYFALFSSSSTFILISSTLLQPSMRSDRASPLHL